MENNNITFSEKVGCNKCPDFSNCAYWSFLAHFERCPWRFRQRPQSDIAIHNAAVVECVSAFKWVAKYNEIDKRLVDEIIIDLEAVKK